MLYLYAGIHFKKVRQVGELIQNQFKTGMSRMERVIRERMTTQEIESVTPKTLINIRPVTAAMKEFFGSSQLSKFMDQINPIAELTDKRRSFHYTHNLQLYTYYLTFLPSW